VSTTFLTACPAKNSCCATPSATRTCRAPSSAPPTSSISGPMWRGPPKDRYRPTCTLGLRTGSGPPIGPRPPALTNHSLPDDRHRSAPRSCCAAVSRRSGHHRGQPAATENPPLLHPEGVATRLAPWSMTRLTHPLETPCTRRPPNETAGENRANVCTALSPRLSQFWGCVLLSAGPVGRASLGTSCGLWTCSVLLDEGPV